MKSSCNCRNHLGKPKTRHKTQGRAVKWIVGRGIRHGMAMEAYPCPTSSNWHVRTKLKENSDG